MDRPKKLVFSDQSYFRHGWSSALIGLAILALSFVIGLATTDATLADLILPFAALGTFWAVWLGFHGFIALIHRVSEKRAINHMFEDEIWEHWQFSASEWQALVNAECKLISPDEEGAKSYAGAIYSSIVGIVFAAILFAVGAFAIHEPQGKTIIRICAVAVFLLCLGVGLCQPVLARYKARRYRHRALRIPEPHVWFTSDGIYHETLGYMSLKELVRVTDQTRSRKAIRFTLAVTTVFGDSQHSSKSTDLVAYSFPVPSGYEERAGQLVRRYRQERFLQ